MTRTFRLGITRDFLRPDGTIGFGNIGLDVLGENARIQHEFLPDFGRELPGSLVHDFDALLVLAPRVSAATVQRSDRLCLIARFGVGYDNVDVSACTRNGVLLTITPAGVRRPVAVSAMTLILALAHKLMIKDRLTREGRWAEKLNYMGIGLTGKTLGLIGLGNIGRELVRIMAPLEMRPIAFDPYASTDVAQSLGVSLVPLDDLLSQSDVVCVTCALTPETHHLLNAQRLSLLQPTAFLINVARGPIMEQVALTKLLSERRIAGAGLDVFEREPVDPQDPILKLDNVIVSPHALCWTDELSRENGRSACRSVLEVSRGRLPQDIVNRDVVNDAGLQRKLSQFR